jgi:hypothetical protein
MSSGPVTVAQWMERNNDRLVGCRWIGVITPEACRSYQCRTDRYVIHFNGDPDPCSRVNADYLRCFDPEPCPHILSDAEVLKLRAPLMGFPADEVLSPRRREAIRRREYDHLTDPNYMLIEDGIERDGLYL